MYIIYCQMDKENMAKIACDKYTFGIMVTAFVLIVAALLWIPSLRRNAALGYPLLAIYTISLSYVAGYISFKVPINIVLGCLIITICIASAMMLATNKVESAMDTILDAFSACKCGGRG